MDVRLTELAAVRVDGQPPTHLDAPAGHDIGTCSRLRGNLFYYRPVALGLWRIAEEDPSRTAIVDARGEAITFGELAERSNRLVHGLRALGLLPGDAIAAILENEPAILELHMAALQGGLYLTPINHHLTPREISYILEDSGARVVVCSAVHAAVCREAVAVLDWRPLCFATGPADTPPSPTARCSASPTRSGASRSRRSSSRRPGQPPAPTWSAT
jgi:acyl-CoA synthetase (AMP-forming)/AMP-acid ligase II